MDISQLQLSDIYRAYRKAKYEAFRDKSHFSVLAYVDYERALDRNLRSLHERLVKGGGKWWKTPSQLGGHLYCPKQVVLPTDGERLHWATLDPITDWRSRCQGKLAEVSFRQILAPSVDYQVFSALWIMTVGAKLDSALNQFVSYGARLSRRWHEEDGVSAGFNEDSLRIFTPYFSSYKEWRENGLLAMKSGLEEGGRIVAVTMDIRRFYHNVSPDFLLSPEFLAALGVQFTDGESSLTKAMVDSIWAWYRETPDFVARPEGALPVGLTASRVISNLLLKSFDDAVLARINPIYYGRYVDDIFLVVKDPGGVDSATSFSAWFASALDGIAVHDTSRRSVLINLPYSTGCSIEFVQDKQKIFMLEGSYGLDLLAQIQEQIRAQSSEYRLLPELEVEEGRFVAKSLLASADTSVVVDALRKADSMSLRRLEFSLLLRDLEAYERDLDPDAWREQRVQFFQIVRRHVITPKGFFEYSAYLYRAIGLGIACGDFDEVEKLLRRFEQVVICLEETSTAKSSQADQFRLCLKYYSLGFQEVLIQAATGKHCVKHSQVSKLLNRIKKLARNQLAGPSPSELRALVKRVLRADLGRRPYKDYWYYEDEKIAYQPSFSKHSDVLRLLRLGAIRSFRKAAKRNRPYWPALAFPTRPLAISEIYLLAPSLFERPSVASSVILALRGARLGGGGSVPPTIVGDSLVVGGKQDPIVDAAITNYLVTPEQWKAAVTGTGDHSLARYMATRRLVRNAMRDGARPKYVIFPECSIPAKWAVSIAAALGRAGISFICGMENWEIGKVVRNDALVSLASDWAGYNCAVMVFQPKLVPAHKEASDLRELGCSLYVPKPEERRIRVYSNAGVRLGVLLCSDLTNIDNRAYFRGRVDCLLALEWNMDIETFAGLVEVTAYDLHAFVVQVNNRAFGDSRVRAPYAERFRRDVVRVKGGESDYYVTAQLNVAALKAFQGGSPIDGHHPFKPLPIGYSARLALDG